MQTIRKKDEITCNTPGCNRTAVVKIEFPTVTYILCEICEEKLKEEIREEHL